MHYMIAEASSAAELESKVNVLLQQGWELQGGLSVATYGAGQWWYYQALVRRRA